MAMQGKEFYQQILGLESPWYVSDVKLDMEALQVNVYVEHPEATEFCCPDYIQVLSCYDHAAPRHDAV
jgi:hypothetical protein